MNDLVEGQIHTFLLIQASWILGFTSVSEVDLLASVSLPESINYICGWLTTS